MNELENQVANTLVDYNELKEEEEKKKEDIHVLDTMIEATKNEMNGFTDLVNKLQTLEELEVSLNY